MYGWYAPDPRMRANIGIRRRLAPLLDGSREELELIQVRGGSIMWAVSEIPTVLYALVVAVQWMRSDDRRAAQWDRKADRDGDAELAAYNAYLSSMRGQAPAQQGPDEHSSEAGATPGENSPR